MFFIGHSHMMCVLTAAKEAGLPFRAVSIKAFVEERNEFGLSRSDLIEDTGKPDFQDHTKSLIATSNGPIYSFISGIQHVQISLRSLSYPSEPMFDFVLPDAPHLPLRPGAEIIPVDAMRQVISATFRQRLKVMSRLAALAPGRVIQFAPPPPAPDHWIDSVASNHLLDRRPTAALRWKLWRLTVGVFHDRARTLGARFVDCPPEALDAEGLMREELVRNYTHGNTAFGRLLLAQIKALS